MTARDYLNDPEFLAWLKGWDKNGEPALEFADWLFDRGLWDQGECVKWVLDRPVIKQWCDDNFYRAKPLKMDDWDDLWVWDRQSKGMQAYSCDLPKGLFKMILAKSKHPDKWEPLPVCFSELLDCYGEWAKLATTEPE